MRRGATPFGTTPESTSLTGFRWLEAPAGHYWADPFLIEHGGSTFLLFEDYGYESGYGTIRGAEVLRDCSLGPTFSCLDLGRHLSFPNVFAHDGETFMIPESLSESDGTVTLYRLRRFPDDWVAEKVLFRGKAVDTTFVARRRPLLLFHRAHERDSRGMKTLLFVADSLTGEWRLHPAKPVSSDVRHARGAGAVFRRQGRLFRPSQDGGPGYGHGLNLDEIVILSEDRYAESTWCAVGPCALPFPAVGIHTYKMRRSRGDRRTPLARTTRLLGAMAEITGHRDQLVGRQQRPLVAMNPKSARTGLSGPARDVDAVSVARTPNPVPSGWNADTLRIHPGVPFGGEGESGYDREMGFEAPPPSRCG